MPLDSLLRRLVGTVRPRRRERLRQRVEVNVPSVFLGTSYGGYAVLPQELSRDSVVYSFGLGEDISFDLALIERVGCTVHAFDPTPRSLAWLGAQALPPELEVHAYGLADVDGVVSFAPPADPAHVSHSVLARDGVSRVELPVRRLATIRRELGHDRIDLLKMDIEGAEYGVIEDMLTAGLLPRQLLLEFHHGMGGVPVARTERTLDALRGVGYRVFDARDSGREFSLWVGASG